MEFKRSEFPPVLNEATGRREYTIFINEKKFIMDSKSIRGDNIAIVGFNKLQDGINTLADISRTGAKMSCKGSVGFFNGKPITLHRKMLKAKNLGRTAPKSILALQDGITKDLDKIVW